MRDVAALANVSIASVSNVVNGHFQMVSGQTRARIEQAMRTVNYSPDARAQGLRSGRTKAVAFLILDEHSRFLADPLTSQMLAGVGDVSRENGYAVLIAAARPSEPVGRLLKVMNEGRAAGACVVLSGTPMRRKRELNALERLSLPYVAFDEDRTSRWGSIVGAENEDGATRLATQLLKAGHRRIGFIGARVPWPVVEQRYRGYCRAHSEAGVEVRSELTLFEGDASAHSGQGMTTRLLALAPPPSAIMAASDLLALGAMNAASEAGLSIPASIAITGFDDFEFAEFTAPPLTTVHVPAYEMGCEAARSVIAGIEHGVPAAATHTFPVSLKMRESSGHAAREPRAMAGDQ